jgi:hypothetical protein
MSTGRLRASGGRRRRRVLPLLDTRPGPCPGPGFPRCFFFPMLHLESTCSSRFHELALVPGISSRTQKWRRARMPGADLQGCDNTPSPPKQIQRSDCQDSEGPLSSMLSHERSGPTRAKQLSRDHDCAAPRSGKTFFYALRFDSFSISCGLPNLTCRREALVEFSALAPPSEVRRTHQLRKLSRSAIPRDKLHLVADKVV